jgi:ABC-type dipeptide/oligopeptide/nickel transport system ATPase component
VESVPRRRPILTGIEFGLRRGEILAIVGEAGSGKSPICYAILGLLPRHMRRTAGQVLYRGKDLTRMAERNLRRLRGPEIAMIVPGGRGSLNPVEAVGTQLTDVLRSHFPRMKKDEMRSRAIQMLTIVGIPEASVLFDVHPDELSGGMAQRMLIAKALICAPRLLVADEFTAGLDVTIQAQILDHMEALVRQTESSTVLTTSDLGIAANYADTVAIVKSGTIIEYATVLEFFAEPRHPYSISLLDAALLAHRHGLGLERQAEEASAAIDPMATRIHGSGSLAPSEMRQVGTWHFVLEKGVP